MPDPAATPPDSPVKTSKLKAAFKYAALSVTTPLALLVATAVAFNIPSIDPANAVGALLGAGAGGALGLVATTLRAPEGASPLRAKIGWAAGLAAGCAAGWFGLAGAAETMAQAGGQLLVYPATVSLGLATGSLMAAFSKTNVSLRRTAAFTVAAGSLAALVGFAGLSERPADQQQPAPPPVEQKITQPPPAPPAGPLDTPAATKAAEKAAEKPAPQKAKSAPPKRAL